MLEVDKWSDVEWMQWKKGGYWGGPGHCGWGISVGGEGWGGINGW